MKILAIDFETANNASESACALGYALMQDGELLASEAFLIKPHPAYGMFYERNIAIHHITAQMVENEPSFLEVITRIAPLFEGAIVIAHNAEFDIRVLSSLCRLYQVKLPPFQYACTVRVGRRVFPSFPNHRLNTMADLLDIELDHHDARSDAMACLQIFAMASSVVGSEHDLLDQLILKEFS
ncbi:MAG: 3'-5' exonuclease [Erysipelotrichaceae bacterium]